MLFNSSGMPQLNYIFGKILQQICADKISNLGFPFKVAIRTHIEVYSVGFLQMQKRFELNTKRAKL